MGGWFIIFISSLVAFFCFLGIARSVRSARRQYWDGPQPSVEQRANNRQWIAEFIERWPSSGLAIENPDLAEQARITRAYKHLEEMYAAGEIDEIDYQIELDRLASAISIDDLIEKLPASPPQRFF